MGCDPAVGSLGERRKDGQQRPEHGATGAAVGAATGPPSRPNAARRRVRPGARSRAVARAAAGPAADRPRCPGSARRVADRADPSAGSDPASECRSRSRRRRAGRDRVRPACWQLSRPRRSASLVWPGMRIGVLTARRRLPRAQRRDPRGRAARDRRGDEAVGPARLPRARRRDSCRSTGAPSRGILPLGGTILRHLGYEPVRPRAAVEQLPRRSQRDAARRADRDRRRGHDGDHAAAHAEHGLPLVGVPKTIDNDLVRHRLHVRVRHRRQIATEAIDRLHTTAESHDRVMVVEVMGRNAGWIAAPRRHRRRRRRDPDPRAADITVEEAAAAIQAAPRARQGLLDHRRRRGRRADLRDRRAAPGRGPRRDRRVRLRAARRRSAHALGARARAADGLRDPRDRRSATSSAAAPRPRATACSPPVTASRRPSGQGRRVRPDGGAAAAAR